MGFFDNVGKTISGLGQSTIQKGKEMADVAKYNGLIKEEEKKIADLYEQIGRRYVELFGDVPEEVFVEYIDNLKAAEERICEYEQKVKDIKGVVKCTNCGAEVSNTSVFCPSCGAKIVLPASAAEKEADEPKCIYCGESLPEGSKFCASCGKPVDAAGQSDTAE